MCEPMMIGAQDDGIFNGMKATFCFGISVMNVALRFVPSAFFAAISVVTKGGFSPCVPCAVAAGALVDSVAFPLIPSAVALLSDCCCC